MRVRPPLSGRQPSSGDLKDQVELKQFNLPDAAQSELLGILGPLRGDIVEVESAATGTPLPDSYQAAPPLAAV